MFATACLIGVVACGDDDNGVTVTFTPQDFAGTYTGQWLNNTFGSSGNAGMVVVINETDSTATVTVDLDGNVLGGTDPAPFTLTSTFTATSAEFSESVAPFGPLTVTVSQYGQISGSAPAVPDPSITSLTFTGQRNNNVITINYVVTFANGSTANGVLTLTLVDAS